MIRREPATASLGGASATFFDIETTGLNPYTDKLVTIQVRRNQESTIWKTWELPEPLMVKHFLEYLDALPRYENLVGYNIMGFDLPFVTARLTLNRMMDETNHTRLYRRKWFDLYHYLGADFRSVDYWLERLGVRRTCPYTGKDIPSLFGSAEYDKIEQHAIEDLELCQRLYTELGPIRNEVIQHGR